MVPSAADSEVFANNPALDEELDVDVEGHLRSLETGEGELWPRNYDSFLESKARRAPVSGFDPPPLSEHLFPHQRDIVTWACRRGSAAVFADTGLGKTLIELEWAHRVCERTGGRVLILAPLAVAAQTQREGRRFGIEVTRARRQGDAGAGITVTNYEMIHTFEPEAFAGIVIDESGILKSFDGKMRNLLITTFARTPYRLACTATPSPNDHTELGNHAEFLGVMKRSEMLAMFFTHDGGDTSEWILKGHARQAFWAWIASWACAIRSPADLGHDGTRFILPPLMHAHHVVKADASHAKKMGVLYAEPVKTLNEQRAARRSTLEDRVRIAAELVATEPEESWLVWCDLNAEGDALEAAIPGAVQVAGSDSAEDKEDALLGFAEGRVRVLVTKPSVAGWGMNWQNCSRVIFVGVTHSYEQYYQATRRVWRFGQQRPVVVHVVTSELEGAVLANLQAKEAAAQEMSAEMVGYMRAEMQRQMGLQRSSARGTYTAKQTIQLPAWHMSEDEEREAS